MFGIHSQSQIHNKWFAIAASSVEKKPTEEPKAKNNDDNNDNENEVHPQNNGSSSIGEDVDESRDQMTSSDPERGQGGADKREQQTCASTLANDEAVQTTLATDDIQTETDTQADTQTTASVPPDVTASSSSTDRNENFDKSEPETASSGALRALSGIFYSVRFRLTVPVA